MSGIRNTVREGNQQFTNKNFLTREYERLSEELGSRLDKTPIELRSPLSTSHQFRLHPDDRVGIDDLIQYPDIILVGKIFLCRTLTPCIKVLSLLTVVEVPDMYFKDKAVFLTLYNYQHPLTQKKETSIKIFPPGTILAVGNPVFSHALADDMYTVRCDNPANVFMLSQNEFDQSFPGLLWPSGKSRNEQMPVKTNALKIKDWKSIGDYWLGKKNYVAALQYYTAAVDHDHVDLEALILRSSMYLHLKLYQKALKDSTEILNKTPLRDEAIYHKASSLIGLRQYEEAIEFLGDYIKKLTSSKDTVKIVKLKKLRVKAETWMNQEKHGNYNLVKMFRCGIAHYHDCADYIGNVVEQKVPGKGRGMIATENIKCGDLLIAAKACAMVICEDEVETNEQLIDTEARATTSRAVPQLHMSIAHQMILDPDVEKAVNNLCDGATESDKNCEKSENKFINMRRINDICNLNSFSQSSHSIYSDGNYGIRVIGLWPVASLFNHGCYDSNSTWKICGNVIFVRASRDIKKGEEITLLYVSYMNEYQDRANTLSKYMIVCKCPLCVADSEDATAVQNRRKKILQELNTLTLVKDAQCSDISQLIVELQQQRLNNPKLNICTILPMIGLAKIYMFKEKYTNAAETLRNVLKITSKTVLTDCSVICCLEGVICSFKFQNLKNLKIFASALKESLIQEYGIYSEELVKFVVPNVAKAEAVLRIMSWIN